MSYQEDRFLEIANAIRAKDGTTAPIKATDFAARIEEIPSGGGEEQFLYFSFTGDKKVKKYSLNTKELVAESAAFGDDLTALSVNDEFVYVSSRFTSPPTVYQLDKNTLEIINTVTVASRSNIVVFAEDYVYICSVADGVDKLLYRCDKNLNILDSADLRREAIFGADSAIIYNVRTTGSLTEEKYFQRLTKNDFTLIGSETSPLGPVTFNSTNRLFCVDSKYLFFTVGTNPNHIFNNHSLIRLDKTNMTDYANSITYGNFVNGITMDKDFVYVGGQTVRQIWKFDKETMDRVAISGNMGSTISYMVCFQDTVLINSGTEIKGCNKNTLQLEFTISGFSGYMSSPMVIK